MADWYKHIRAIEEMHRAELEGRPFTIPVSDDGEVPAPVAVKMAVTPNTGDQKGELPGGYGLTPEEEKRAREALRPGAAAAEDARRAHAAAWAELNRQRGR